MSNLRESQRISGPVLRLPPLDEAGLPGGRILRGVTRLTLGVAMLVGVFLVVGASLVTVDITVDVSGALEPSRVWAVRARVSGAIAEVLVATGDTVRSGQPVARLDTVAAATAVAQLEAQLEIQRVDEQRMREAGPIERELGATALLQAETRRMRARASLRERMIAFRLSGEVDSLLRAYDAGTHIGLDVAIADVLLAESEVSAARAEMQRAALTRLDIAKQHYERKRLAAQLSAQRIERARSFLSAPADGVVLSDDLELLSGAVVTEGQTVLEIADVGVWRAKLTLPEGKVHRVRIGDRAFVDVHALAALQSEPMSGRVVAIASDLGTCGIGSASSVPGGTVNGRTAGYCAIVALDDESVKALGGEVLRRGYSVEAHLVTRSARLIVLVRDWVREQRRRGER